MELEADEYSGFVMFKLGASLSQAQQAVRLISPNKDDSYSTHPSRDKRLAAIKRGYNKAKSKSSNSSANMRTKGKITKRTTNTKARINNIKTEDKNKVMKRYAKFIEDSRFYRDLPVSISYQIKEETGIQALEGSTKISREKEKEIQAYILEDKPKLVKKGLEKYCL